MDVHRTAPPGVRKAEVRRYIQSRSSESLRVQPSRRGAPALACVSVSALMPAGYASIRARRMLSPDACVTPSAIRPGGSPRASIGELVMSVTNSTKVVTRA